MNYEVQPTDYTWLTIQQLILEEAAADVATDSQMSEGKIERSDEQVTIERDFFTAYVSPPSIASEDFVC